MITIPRSHVKYGFKLTFPDTPFTIRDLRNQKARKISYITIRKRVEKALLDGVIAPVGNTPAARSGRGRPQSVYSLVKA